MTWSVFLCQLYLQNLGIDQSPADILTPFAPRGPIREPEFSPTDLSTVKDFSSGGTPMKSITSSEGPPPKNFFSLSSENPKCPSMCLEKAETRSAGLPFATLCFVAWSDVATVGHRVPPGGQEVKCFRGFAKLI